MGIDIEAPVELDMRPTRSAGELSTAAQSMRYRAATFALPSDRAREIVARTRSEPVPEREDGGTAIVAELDPEWLVSRPTVDDTSPANPRELQWAIDDRATFDSSTADGDPEWTELGRHLEAEWSIYGNNAGVDPDPAIVRDAIRCIERLSRDSEPPWRQYLWSDDLEKYVWPELTAERAYDTTEVGVTLSLLARLGLMGIKQRSNRRQFWYGENVAALEGVATYLERRQSMEYTLPLGDSSNR